MTTEGWGWWWWCRRWWWYKKSSIKTISYQINYIFLKVFTENQPQTTRTHQYNYNNEIGNTIAFKSFVYIVLAIPYRSDKRISFNAKMINPFVWRFVSEREFIFLVINSTIILRCTKLSKLVQNVQLLHCNVISNYLCPVDSWIYIVTLSKDFFKLPSILWRGISTLILSL